MDQRVIDIVQNIEDGKAPDYEQRPRSKSFAENGSLSRAKGNIKKLEQDEKEREAKEQLKTVSNQEYVKTRNIYIWFWSVY